MSARSEAQMQEDDEDGQRETMGRMWRVREEDVGQFKSGRAAQQEPESVEYEVIVRGVNECSDEENNAMAEQRIALRSETTQRV